ncbi:hypothetical protein P7K49_008993, partial [Saguinus oedipus]
MTQAAVDACVHTYQLRCAVDHEGSPTHMQRRLYLLGRRGKRHRRQSRVAAVALHLHTHEEGVDSGEHSVENM